MKTIIINNTEILMDDDTFELLKDKSIIISPDGYPKMCVGKPPRMVGLHRVIMGTQFDEGSIVDHIDRNKCNIQRLNLRQCSYQDNLRNSEKRKIQCTSAFKGVSWHSKRNYFMARITINYKTVLVFTSKVEIECAFAYNVAAEFLFKEYGYLNPVEFRCNKIKEEVIRTLKYKYAPA